MYIRSKILFLGRALKTVGERATVSRKNYTQFGPLSTFNPTLLHHTCHFHVTPFQSLLPSFFDLCLSLLPSVLVIVTLLLRCGRSYPPTCLLRGEGNVTVQQISVHAIELPSIDRP